MNLSLPVDSAFRLQPAQRQALLRLNLRTLSDLIYYFPSRYSTISEVKNISELVLGEKAVIYGKISGLKTAKGFKSKMTFAEAAIEDRTGHIKAVWFRQPYIAKMFTEGDMVKLSGTVTERKNALYFNNPEIEKTKDMPIDAGNSLFKATAEMSAFSYPVYPETRGITSKWFYHAIQKAIKAGALENITDPIPEEITQKYHLPSLKTALVWIHAPKEKDHAEAARKRFAFEEIFFIQLVRQMARAEFEKNKSFIIRPKKNDVEEFISRFPFTPTDAQSRALADVLKDMGSGKPMLRLLEGDVGSGKTFVAAAVAYTLTQEHAQANEYRFTKLQTAYMAPTEILANQHFESFIKYFSHLPVTVGLITGSGCKKFPSKVSPDEWTKISRPQLLKWVASGEVDILFGTHALIQKSVKFKNLALVIIDEQHRFGTAQRMNLVKKGGVAPHFLSMTATPIPRTLALTIYGDLDLTLLDAMPPGRKPVLTEIVLAAHREKMYAEIRRELSAGKQAYVICPRIDEPDPEKELALNAKSVKEEAKRLKKNVFQEYEIGILHGKMTPKEKEEIMGRFERNEIKILCATSVVEVGVNVPNATVIAIEGAERFGLSQLHQLRGRVIRSNDQAYCYLLTDSFSPKTAQRLKALKTAKNGFELSELDLTLRGSGELSGKKQWGISDLGMEAIKNIKMVEAARTEAREMLASDPDLKKHPALAQKIAKKDDVAHFE
jgi:ATP-dependent DNA helicase RecG